MALELSSSAVLEACAKPAAEADERHGKEERRRARAPATPFSPSTSSSPPLLSTANSVVRSFPLCAWPLCAWQRRAPQRAPQLAPSRAAEAFSFLSERPARYEWIFFAHGVRLYQSQEGVSPL